MSNDIPTPLADALAGLIQNSGAAAARPATAAAVGEALPKTFREFVALPWPQRKEIMETKPEYYAQIRGEHAHKWAKGRVYVAEVGGSYYGPKPVQIGRVFPEGNFSFEPKIKR